MNIRITNLEDLKKWNSNPTVEKPIIYDWFLRWFFEQVLMKNKKALAKDAYETIIQSCMICENFSREQAIERINRALGYYSGYSSEWGNKLNEFFPKIKHPILG